MSILLQRRWRNQRAAANLNQQQQSHQQQPKQALASSSSSTAANQNAAGSLMQPPLGQLQQQQQPAKRQSPPTSALNETAAKTGDTCAPTRAQYVRQSSTLAMQLQQLRPAGARPGVSQQQHPNQAALQHQLSHQQPATPADSHKPAAGGEPAVAQAMARFKMLRANMVAAASLIRLPGATEQPPTQPEADAPLNLMAMRTKDERVVNMLSGTGTKVRLS